MIIFQVLDIMNNHNLIIIIKKWNKMKEKIKFKIILTLLIKMKGQ